MKLKVKFTGDAELLRKMRNVKHDLPKQAEYAAVEEMTQVLSEAQRRVPIDTGQLRDSAGLHVERQNKSTRVQIYFDAPHAVAVHEDLEANHPDGQPKFLESAVDEAESGMVARIGRHINLRKAVR